MIIPTTPWSCHRCTLDNPAGASCCEACGSLPKAPAGVRPAHAPAVPIPLPTQAVVLPNNQKQIYSTQTYQAPKPIAATVPRPITAPLHFQPVTQSNRPQIFRIREKAWGDNFTITDDQDNFCYRVRGKIFALGNQLSLRDARDNKLAYIRSQFSLQPRYEILDSRKQRLLAFMTKQWSLFDKKFTLEIGNQIIQIEGQFLRRDYTFACGNRVVARVSKKRFSWTDSYSVEVYGGIDTVVLLCACIVIDQVLYDNKR